MAGVRAASFPPSWLSPSRKGALPDHPARGPRLQQPSGVLVLRTLVMILLAASVPSAAAAERLRLDQTDPAHQRAINRPVIVPPSIAPRIRYDQSTPVYSLPDGLDRLAKADRALSDLCQRGAFNQRMDGYYWARTKVRRYGVAFENGGSLIDPQNRRKPGNVYLFSHDNGRCTVYVAELQTLQPHYIGR